MNKFFKDRRLRLFNNSFSFDSATALKEKIYIIKNTTLTR